MVNVGHIWVIWVVLRVIIEISHIWMFWIHNTKIRNLGEEITIGIIKKGRKEILMLVRTIKILYSIYRGKKFETVGINFIK